MRDIIIAKESGFCFGVKRAVNMALDSAKNSPKKIYTLGPLIHNNDVVNKLEENKIFSIDLEEARECNPNDTIIIRSHGVKPSVICKLKKAKLNIIDATCPYVATIQNKVALYYNKGYNIIIVGDHNHPEVQGINGFCNNEAIIIKDGSELKSINGKVCIVSQTTEKIENYNSVITRIKLLGNEYISMNTICKATTLRQTSAFELSKQVDLMLVIGGKDSSNTNKLYEICKENCEHTFHIENALKMPKLIKSEKIIKVGITAGASTPSWIIEEVIEKCKK